MAVTRDRPAPYAPAKTVLDLIGRYRDRGLPTPVDSDVLARAGVPESLIPRTLQALQTLDLIEADGCPSAALEGLRLAPEPEFKARLAEWLQTAYADAFTFVDPTKDDETRVRDAFRSYIPVGQQTRMVSLFLGLCAAAGLRPEKASSSRASPARPRSAPSPGRPAAPKTATAKPPVKPSARSSTRSSTSTTSTPTGLPASVTGLLQHLPNGNGWTQAERDNWLSTFKVVVEFAFPIVEPEEEAATDDP